MPDEDATTVFEQPTPVVVADNENEDEKETKEMAIDLPESVAVLLLKSGSEAYQQSMADTMHNGSLANSLSRLGAVKTANELGTIESRANSGVMATPVAGPTTP